MITTLIAQTVRNFEHATLKGSDGLPIRCRATGKCKIWKTRPDDFKLPVKYGLYESFYLTPANANDWVVPRPAKDEVGGEEPTQQEIDESNAN